MGILTKPGFDFCFDQGACKTCDSLCCRGEPGNIWATRFDVQTICNFLKINMIDGMELYFKRVGNRFSIKDSHAGDDDWPCVFFMPEKGCLIYPVRPRQCRTFPFWSYYKTNVEELFDQCPGVRPLKLKI